MIGTIRTYIDQQFYRMWRLYARVRRATVASDVIFRGRPLIHCVKGAEIRLDSGVRVNSSIESNPIMMRARSIICCVTPGARIILERNVGASGVTITAALEVVIGEGTLLGADCIIIDTDFHLPLPDHRWGNDVLASASPIRIGKGCFIGARAVILKGVKIGDGAVVAAGAVVIKDVPAAYLAAGNPAVSRPLPNKWLHPEIAKQSPQP
jgi:acetyltransferase-like isoleucine patch superfamily enzyme